MFTSEFDIRVVVSEDSEGGLRFVSLFKPNGHQQIVLATTPEDAVEQLKVFLESSTPEQLLAFDVFGNQRRTPSPTAKLEAAWQEIRRHIALVQDEGTADHQRGVGETEGPYEPGTSDHQYWLEGWKAAQLREQQGDSHEG